MEGREEVERLFRERRELQREAEGLQRRVQDRVEAMMRACGENPINE